MMVLGDHLSNAKTAETAAITAWLNKSDNLIICIMLGSNLRRDLVVITNVQDRLLDMLLTMIALRHLSLNLYQESQWNNTIAA